MRPWLLLLFYFSTIVTFGQTGNVTGNILDAETRIPLGGANINISTSNKSGNTDNFGNFRFGNIPIGLYELVATHIGYHTEIIPVEVKKNLTSTVSVSMRKGGLDLSEVRISSKKSQASNTLGQVDIQLRPINTSQDILRIVPGIFIAQHAGGGKAEQIFLRGFDIDHGTDIALSVDGLPVNMVSHAHGQGYADLHFLIPESVEKVAFEMGPYNANKGNLATAGFVDFKTRDFLESNNLKLEVGRFNTQRISGMVKLYDELSEKKKEQVYVASEFFRSNSYFESPQHFHRFNILAKYNLWLTNQSQFTVMASTFNSKWDASGQIPERAVADGSITRYGSIDDSEGGNTNRSNFSIRYSKQLKKGWSMLNQAYYSRYHFNLYSNFTFFLDDPVNGDAINQRESRNTVGYFNSFTRSWMLGNKKATSEIGTGIRLDDVNEIVLSKVVKRKFLSFTQKGDIKERNAYAYLDQQVDVTDKFNINAGLRFDHFLFSYRNELAGQNEFKSQARGVLSPKLNFSFSVSPTIRLFFENGIGFHSNDTRVILNNDVRDILPKVYGTDVGVILKPIKALLLKTTLWHLYSEQEFVYVGDAGIVEPGGETRRMGIEISARYQLNKWLFADADINWTRARTIGSAKGEDHVPLAPSVTSVGGLTVGTKNKFSGSLRYRVIGDRPANEDYTVTAKGYFLTDIVLALNFRQIDLTLSIENLFDSNWNEAQFDTESRLQNESIPVSELHFTPGTPRFIKAGINFKF
jgi:outer membrane cobalamin receptor